MSTHVCGFKCIESIGGLQQFPGEVRVGVGCRDIFYSIYLQNVKWLTA